MSRYRGNYVSLNLPGLGPVVHRNTELQTSPVLCGFSFIVRLMSIEMCSRQSVSWIRKKRVDEGSVRHSPITQTKLLAIE